MGKANAVFGGDVSGVDLYFIRQSRKKECDTTYDVLHAPLSAAAGAELVGSVCKHLETIMSSGTAPVAYDDRTDDDAVLTIEQTRVDGLQTTLARILLNDVTPFTSRARFSGYILAIRSAKTTLFIFRRALPRSLMEKGKTIIQRHAGVFDVPDSHPLVLDGTFDAMMATVNDAQNQTNPVTIVNLRRFEALFSLLPEEEQTPVDSQPDNKVKVIMLD